MPNDLLCTTRTAHPLTHKNITQSGLPFKKHPYKHDQEGQRKNNV